MSKGRAEWNERRRDTLVAGVAATRGSGDALHLTFDDGPDPVGTPAVLERLDFAGALATFFVMPGRHPELIAEIAARGHEVGYHCGRHVRHSERSRAAVACELADDLDLLAAIGIEPRSWRTPWGDLAPWTGELAAAAGLRLWGWSDDTEDWAGHGGEAMLDGLKRTLLGGSVVLMHDGIGPGSRRTDPTNTVELVEPLCELGRERGLHPRSLGGAGSPDAAADTGLAASVAR